MKNCIIMLMLLLPGCMSTPSWWETVSGVDVKVLDHYFWAKHLYGQTECAMGIVCSEYPPDVVGPVVADLLHNENNPQTRLEIIESLRNTYIRVKYGAR